MVKSVKWASVYAFHLLVGLSMGWVVPVEAKLLELRGDKTQGGMLVGKAEPGDKVTFNGEPLELSPEGYFVFGVGRDAKPTHELTVISPQGKAEQHQVTITDREWRIEKIDGLPQSKVTPKAPDVLKRIREEAGLVWKARQTRTENTYFLQDFIWPANGRISGVYGSQRILNGEPKRPHFGVDVAAPVGTPVVAPAAGVVTLVHKDMFYSGGTLIIDHGHGISSTFIHLNSIEVKEGEQVAQGQRIATIGATGRASGPHLDWRLNWFNERLDPQLLVKDKHPSDHD